MRLGTEATKDIRSPLEQQGIARPVPGLVEAVFGVQFFFAQERQNQNPPTVPRLAIRPVHECWRKRLVLVVVVVKCEADLLEIPLAWRRRIFALGIGIPRWPK